MNPRLSINVVFAFVNVSLAFFLWMMSDSVPSGDIIDSYMTLDDKSPNTDCSSKIAAKLRNHVLLASKHLDKASMGHTADLRGAASGCLLGFSENTPPPPN